MNGLWGSCTAVDPLPQLEFDSNSQILVTFAFLPLLSLSLPAADSIDN